jgi:predicted Zn-dependent protease
MTLRSAIFLSVLTLAGCVRNPATGERQLNLISESEEIQLGQQAAQEVSQTVGLYGDAKLQGYVDGLGKKLAAISDRPNVPWQFHVVDDASVNAFALPGGPIFVTRGILASMTSEAELATVVGHEIGHVAARHSVNQLSKAQLAQLGLGVGSILSPTLARFGQLAGAGLQLLFLKYSRDAENQADELGFRYALKGGYDVRQMKELFVLLEKLSAQQQGRLPEWMATHPNPENRLQSTEKRLAKVQGDLSGLVSNRDGYLAAINGIVFGENPRHGFFKGNSFLHPDLKFRIDFPQGWKTANQPQAVAAISPNQDAITSLEIVGQMSPEEAAQKFFSNQAIRPGTTSKGNVNGFPALSGTFQAQTDQGNLEGLANFISYGGKTFALLEYTAAGKLSSYEQVFRQVLGSFNILTDPEALNVQPARVEVVKVPRDMTLEQFNSQYPSSIPVDQLALINGVDKGAVLRAGTAVKRVVGGIQQPRAVSKTP